MRIGIDLGGTKIEGVALAGDGRDLARIRVGTPRGDYEATVAAIASVVDDVERTAIAVAPDEAAARASIGVGIPGCISPATGLVKNANSTWLIGHPLDKDLEDRLGRPIRIANDANCFALSEAVDGAAAGARVTFGVIIGTGTGGGIVVDGVVIEGANRIAGEWGHNPLPWPEPDERPGEPCYCGRAGCTETWLSGPALARDFERATGGKLGAEAIVVRARAGDPDAAAALDRYHSRMARALATVINMVDPDVIVLGGGLSGIDSLYTAVPRLWPRFVFSDRVQTRLVRARHGDASGVRGAAMLWPVS
jgi:fructokinase